jgi:hypothetical protein
MVCFGTKKDKAGNAKGSNLILGAIRVVIRVYPWQSFYLRLSAFICG